MMKNLYRLFLPLVLTAGGFISCNDDPNDSGASTPEIRVTPAEGLTFEAEGGTLSLTVEASGTVWDVSKDASWINVSPQVQEHRIDVTVGPYEEIESRSGTITVSGKGAEPVLVKVIQNGVVPTLEVSPTQLDFGCDASHKTIVVSVTNGIAWQAETPDASWISLEADPDNGSVRVNVEENTEKAPRSGKFRITAEGAEAVSVAVSQEGAADFWARSIAYRMGYLGKIKFADRHVDYVNHLGEIVLTDLQFDENGNLLSFRRDANAMTVTLEYDTSNRPTVLTARSSDRNFSILFEYGTHGKYIPIFELFEYDLDILFPVDFRIWMPFLFKDLTAIEIRDQDRPDNNLDYRVSVSGNTGSYDAYYETGEEYWPQYYDFVFEADYIKQVNSAGEEYGNYQIDAASGKITRQVMHSYYEIVYERALDRRNTITRAEFGSYEMTLAYNESLDLTSRTMLAGSDMPSLTALYEYDTQGNWIKGEFTENGGETATVERTLSYWQ